MEKIFSDFKDWGPLSYLAIIWGTVLFSATVLWLLGLFIEWAQPALYQLLESLI